MSGMMGRRSPRDGDSSRPAALPGGCRSIGEQLAGERTARRLSVEDVASRLMLSKSQVVGLERADAAPFYNTAYFERALRKYMAFAGLPENLLRVSNDHEEVPGLRLALADVAPARPAAGSTSARTWPMGVAAVVLVAVAAGVYAYWSRDAWTFTRGSDIVAFEPAELLPAQPIRVPAVPPPVSVVPTSTVLADPATEPSTVRISVGKATWVFVRYPDNRVVERRLEAGTELEVGPLPVYLAVGTAESVEVRVEDRPVPLQPYIRNGQIRITKPELAALKDTAIRR